MWMPHHARRVLIEGFIAWQQWLNPGPDSAIYPLFEAAFDARERKVALEVGEEWSAVIAAAAAESSNRLGLLQAPAILAERLIATGAIGVFVAGSRRQRRVRRARQGGG